MKPDSHACAPGAEGATGRAGAVVSPFRPTRSGALHLRLVEDLRRLINEGELEPGSRVQEKALCERFGVSRTPLREALKVLAFEGLVTLLPRRGARVAVLDEAYLRDVFAVVAALEAEAGRLACERIDAAGLAAVALLHDAMVGHYRREDLPAYFEANQRIHDAIVAAAGNAVLAATHASLAARIVRARYLANRLDAERWHRAVAEHEAILDALGRGDGDALGRLLQAHFLNKQDAILAQLAERRRGALERA